MKTLLLLLIIIASAASNHCFSQHQAIGWSKKMILEMDREWKTDVNDDGVEFMYYDTDFITCLFNFDEDDICRQVIMVPHGEENLLYYIRSFNEDLIKDGDNKWVFLRDTQIITVTFIATDEGGMFDIEEER
jgi:spore maturation protein CgeB